MATEAMQKELKKQAEDIKELFSKAERHRDDIEKVAKLATYTARTSERLEAKHTLTVYLNGGMKDKVHREFQDYRKRNRQQQRDSVMTDDTFEDADDRELAARTKKELAVDTGKKKWKEVFTGLVVDWATEQAGSKNVLQEVVAEAQKLDLSVAVANQRFHGKGEPVADKPWACSLELDGGASGTRLYEILRHGLRRLYVRGGEVGVGPSGGGKDRAITAEVARIGDVPVRDGRAPATKRKSPDPARSSNARRRV